MLRAHELSCLYDDRTVFSNLSLSVNAGELVQISGANGSGKTSLLRILSGLSRPDSGQVCWQGEPLAAVRDDFHRQMLWLSHKTGVKSALTADENLRFLHPHSRLAEREQALGAIGLAGYEDLPLDQLSAGQQRRVALARLWLTDTRLWMLDEPFTALDVAGIETLTRQLEQHVLAGGSVLMTTHQPLRPLICPLRAIALNSEGER